jgi:hypothetical protein
MVAAVSLLSLTACGTVTSSFQRPEEAELVVQMFCRSFGQQRGSAVLKLFADSARFDMEDVSVSFVGRQNIAHLVEYGAAVHDRLTARDFEVAQDTVRCRIEESNDWFGLLGVGRVAYDGRFRVSGGRILGVQFELTPHSREELSVRMASFLIWLRTQDPEVLDRLLPGGRPAYDAGVVPQMLNWLRRWQSRTR